LFDCNFEKQIESLPALCDSPRDDSEDGGPIDPDACRPSAAVSSLFVHPSVVRLVSLRFLAGDHDEDEDIQPPCMHRQQTSTKTRGSIFVYR
jgi:hypothetical protein